MRVLAVPVGRRWLFQDFSLRRLLPGAARSDDLQETIREALNDSSGLDYLISYGLPPSLTDKTRFRPSRFKNQWENFKTLYPDTEMHLFIEHRHSNAVIIDNSRQQALSQEIRDGYVGGKQTALLYICLRLEFEPVEG